jgi:lysophospholipase L1-like esterase
VNPIQTTPETAPEPTPKVGRTRGILLALVLTAIGLEFAARVIDQVQGRDTSTYAPVSPLRSFYEPHPFIGFVLKPNSSREASPEAPPDRRYSFHINSLGFRGRQISKQKPPGVTRILCVGGSSTYGTGASRDDLTYPARLERMLNQAVGGPRFEVVNCGTVGYGTAENLINLELRLLDLDPDAVIVYHAANDALALQMRGFKSDYSHLRTTWIQTEPNPLDDFLLSHVRLYAWATRGLDPKEMSSNMQTIVMAPEFADHFLPPGEPLDPEALPTFERNLKNIAAVLEAADVELYLSTFATCLAAKKPTDNDYTHTVDLENEVIERVASEHGLPLLDVARFIRDQRPLFDDWMHLNDEGEFEHAKAVFDELKRLGLLGL